MKKILCLVLALSFVFSALSTAGFADNEVDIYEENMTQADAVAVLSDETPTDAPADPSVPAPPSSPDKVARVWLCSKANPLPKPGHLFIYIQNISQKDITVGLMTVHPGEGVSMASWGLQKKDGFGTYYNVECNHYSDTSYQRTIAISQEIDENRLARVTRTINNINYWDMIFYNCTFFACAVWNAASIKKVVPCPVPSVTRMQVKMWGSGDMPRMFHRPDNEVYKVRGLGSNARLEVASEASLG